MQPLERLYRHNAWANARLLTAALGASPEALAAGGPGGASILDRIAHFAETEDAFSLVFAGTPDWPHPPESIAELATYLMERDERLLAVAAGLSPETAAATCFVPWFNREVPVEDCLYQVLHHSNQGRSEAAWELRRAGVDTGDLDYIVWLLEEGAP